MRSHWHRNVHGARPIHSLAPAAVPQLHWIIVRQQFWTPQHLKQDINDGSYEVLFPNQDVLGAALDRLPTIGIQAIEETQRRSLLSPHHTPTKPAKMRAWNP